MSGVSEGTERGIWEQGWEENGEDIDQIFDN